MSKIDILQPNVQNEKPKKPSILNWLKGVFTGGEAKRKSKEALKTINFSGENIVYILKSLIKMNQVKSFFTNEHGDIVHIIPQTYSHSMGKGQRYETKGIKVVIRQKLPAINTEQMEAKSQDKYLTIILKKDSSGNLVNITTSVGVADADEKLSAETKFHPLGVMRSDDIDVQTGEFNPKNTIDTTTEEESESREWLIEGEPYLMAFQRAYQLLHSFLYTGADVGPLHTVSPPVSSEVNVGKVAKMFSIEQHEE